jgi:hypothetical protein
LGIAINHGVSSASHDDLEEWYLFGFPIESEKTIQTVKATAGQSGRSFYFYYLLLTGLQCMDDDSFIPSS